jgi:bacillithiol system protein YtxJ
MQELRTQEAVDAALAGSGVIFKHSSRCPVSSDAYDEVAAFEEAHPDVPVYVVDVIASRPVSQHLARVTGVLHQSPQALVVEDGTVRWHGSHYAINALALARHASGGGEKPGEFGG